MGTADQSISSASRRPRSVHSRRSTRKKRLAPVVLSLLVTVPALEAAAYWCDWNGAECIKWENEGYSKIKDKCVKWPVKCYR